MKIILILIGFLTPISAVSGMQREPLNQWTAFGQTGRLMFNGRYQVLPSSIKGVPEDWQEKYRSAVEKESKKAIESFPVYVKMRKKLREIQRKLEFEDDHYEKQPHLISAGWRFNQSGGNGPIGGSGPVNTPSNYGGYNGAAKGVDVPLIYKHEGDTGHGIGVKKVGATLPYKFVHEYFLLITDRDFSAAVATLPHFYAIQSALTDKQFDSLMAISAKYDGVNAFVDASVLFALEADEVQRHAFGHIYESGRIEIEEWLAEWASELKKYKASADKLQDYRRLITLKRKIEKSQYSLESDLLDVLTESQLKKYKKWMNHRIHRVDVDVVTNGQKLFVKRSEPLIKLPEPPK